MKNLNPINYKQILQVSLKNLKNYHNKLNKNKMIQNK